MIPYVLYAGNIKPQKNLPRLIEAFAVAKAELRDHPEFSQSQTAGDRRCADEHADLRRAVVRSRVREDVRFLGFVPHPVLRVFYSRARAFLFPFAVRRLRTAAARGHGARHAGADFQRVVAAGSVFSEAALLVNPENVFDIARGIRQILTEDVLRETLIRRGYELAQRYSWERSARAGARSLPLCGRGRAGKVHRIKTQKLNTEDTEKRGDRPLPRAARRVSEDFSRLSQLFLVSSVLNSVVLHSG